MAKKSLYRGFSTFEFERVKSFRLTDIELVKLDLLNHIFTRKGDRVMMPTFGTSVPDIVFEPLDEETLDTLEEELMAVFDYDPRVEVIDFTITPDYDFNTIVAAAKLFYVELNVTDDFELNIDFEEG